MRHYSHMQFHDFAKAISHAAGRPATFVIAMVVLLAWAISGPIFHFSDTWQLIINTSTTIITFLMVFLIQNTQNRDSQATQLKLDELIRAVGGAKNSLLDLEEMTDEELEELRDNYLKLAEAARVKMKKVRKAG